MTNQREYLITSWLQRCGRAVEALYSFQSYLAIWAAHDEAIIADDMFMSVLDDMAQAGLLEFMDGGPLDELRAILTGLEPPFCGDIGGPEALFLDTAENINEQPDFELDYWDVGNE